MYVQNHVCKYYIFCVLALAGICINNELPKTNSLRRPVRQPCLEKIMTVGETGGIASMKGRAGRQAAKDAPDRQGFSPMLPRLRLDGVVR